MVLIGILTGGLAGWLSGKIIFVLFGQRLYQNDDPEYREAIAINLPYGFAAIGALIGGSLVSLL
ncbi:MAG: hypothetical protein WCK32_01705 [Chlorobiaceae bacterium]